MPSKTQNNSQRYPYPFDVSHHIIIKRRNVLNNNADILKANNYVVWLTEKHGFDAPNVHDY